MIPGLIPFIHKSSFMFNISIPVESRPINVELANIGDDITEPIDFFHFFFPNDLINTLVKETNLYAIFFYVQDKYSSGI